MPQAKTAVMETPGETVQTVVMETPGETVQTVVMVPLDVKQPEAGMENLEPVGRMAVLETLVKEAKMEEMEPSFISA